MKTEKIALEALPLGEAWAQAFAADEVAIAARLGPADAKIWTRRLSPTTADAVAQYTGLTDRLGRAGYDAGLADLHARALVDNEPLAALLRSVEALDDIATAAASLAAPAHPTETHAAAGARAAVAAVKRYKLTIARQLAATEGHELAPAARELLAADALAERLAVARKKHEEHAQAELARAEAERRAAARVVIDRTAARVRAAEAQAADDRAKATRSAGAYRHARADALVERLRASGLRELRVGSGELYDVSGVIAVAHGLSLEQIERYEATLAATEAA